MPCFTQADSPIELDAYANLDGMLRTQRGWFPASHLAIEAAALTFDVDTRRHVQPNTVDRAIIEQASRLLASTAAWNHADDRHCATSASTWSLYCAIHDASIEVSGGFHPRRPAAELVRTIIEERAQDRQYRHDIMDYNNDARTRLSDIKSLLTDATSRIR
jgi:hypothetical protein